MKKTFKVSDLKKNVNSMLAGSTCSAGIRDGMATVLGEVLHATGNYAGFGYLTQEQVPTGEKPGIIRGEEPNENQFPDDSRRFYY